MQKTRNRLISLQIRICNSSSIQENFGHLSIDFKEVPLIAGAVFIEGGVLGVAQSGDVTDVVRSLNGMLEHDVIGIYATAGQIPAVFCPEFAGLGAVITNSTGDADGLD